MTRWCFNAVVMGALAVASMAASAGPPAVGPRLAAGASATEQRAPVSTAAPGTTPDIDACVTHLDSQLDIGYDRIAARCPDLMRQLGTGAWAPWLPRGWNEPGNDLSAGSLKEFRELVSRESGARDSTSVEPPDVHALQPILTALAGSHSETGWSRFKSWLRSILERREQPTDESWFSRMVSQTGVSQSLIRLITYAALAAVVVLAGMIVLNELRTAGVLSKRASGPRGRRAQTSGDTSELGWGAIEQAPVPDRPRLLLETIARRLTLRGFLPPAGALTIRELTRAARLPDADDRTRLSELALAAERVRFSQSRAQDNSLDEPIARGRELLQRLEGAAG